MLRRMLCQVVQDDSGAAGSEWAFVASILVLGSVVGLLAVRAELFGQGNSQDTTAHETRAGNTAGR